MKPLPMKPRKLTVEGIEIIVEGCDDCLLCHANDEMGYASCMNPLTTHQDIESSYKNPHEWFPVWCPLKEFNVAPLEMTQSQKRLLDNLDTEVAGATAADAIVALQATIEGIKKGEIQCREE